jgi:chaperonin GroEL
MQVTKEIIKMNELRPIALVAMKEIAGIVKRTLGPGGNAILLERVGQALDGSPLTPKITKDGVSVAEECASPDPYKNVIIQSVKAICKKTNATAGDGTTTAIVLGEAILTETYRMLEENKDLNPQLVKESIEAAAKEVFALLKKETVAVEDMEMLEHVATISANGDREIGRIIRQAFDHVGKEGVITVDEGRGENHTLDVVEGYQFNKGAEARHAFFNNKELTQFEAEKVAVIIYDGKLVNFNDIIPAIQLLADADEEGRPRKAVPPTLFIANEFSNEVLQFMLIQKTERGMPLMAVTGPNTTHVRSGYYDDLAVYLGANRLGNGARGLANIQADDIGLAARVVVSKYSTTIYEGQGTEDAILERVGQLNAAKTQAESPYDVQILNDRLAALTNGIAKIGVGGSTELEIKEKYDRIEDALNAARAALQEGVVAGGGSTLLRISCKLPNKTIGQKILKNALKAPILQILENIGLPQKDQVLISIEVSKRRNKVYDARHRKFVNGITAGIIDPVKVTKAGLENALSIATLISTAGGAIVYKNLNQNVTS